MIVFIQSSISINRLLEKTFEYFFFLKNNISTIKKIGFSFTANFDRYSYSGVSSAYHLKLETGPLAKTFLQSLQLESRVTSHQQQSILYTSLIEFELPTSLVEIDDFSFLRYEKLKFSNLREKQTRESRL